LVTQYVSIRTQLSLVTQYVSILPRHRTAHAGARLPPFTYTWIQTAVDEAVASGSLVITAVASLNRLDTPSSLSSPTSSTHLHAMYCPKEIKVRSRVLLLDLLDCVGLQSCGFLQSDFFALLHMFHSRNRIPFFTCFLFLFLTIPMHIWRNHRNGNGSASATIATIVAASHVVLLYYFLMNLFLDKICYRTLKKRVIG
jgi:hypothetical protein